MFRGLIVTLVTILVHGVATAQDLKSLRPWIPEDINAIAILRVAEILDSPLAKQEGWQHSGSSDFLNGAATLPPDCQLVVRATRFRPGAGENWSAALLSFSRPVDMQRVAAQEQAPVQQVLSHPAVASSRNCFFARLQPQLLGVVSPAYRQDLARWIERGERNQDPALNRYLDEVLLGQSAALTMALDLTEMFDPDRLRARLLTMGAILGKQNDVDRIVARLMDVRGLRLDVYVTDEMRAALTLDFQNDIGSDGPLMAKILTEALGDLGASLDSFKRSEPTVEGPSVRLAAVFSEEDLRRVMTLMLSPHPADTPAPPAPQIASAPSSRPPRVVEDNNVRYFRSIDQILQDLTKANRNAQDYHRTATWHDNFANKIDQLSTLAVDRDLVNYGAFVSSRLRSIAASLRGVGVDINTLNKSVVYNTRVNPGYEQVGWWTYGYQPATWEVNSNLADVRAKQADAIMAGSKDREAIWQMINDERARVLAAMTAKYGDAFTSGIKKK